MFRVILTFLVYMITSVMILLTILQEVPNLYIAYLLPIVIFICGIIFLIQDIRDVK